MSANAELRFYHRPDDPWSHLLLQVLPQLIKSYRVEVECVTVPFPDIAHAPRPQMLARHALRDARDLADYYQIEFESKGDLPAEATVSLASRALLVPRQTEEYLGLAFRIGVGLFSGDTESVQALCSSFDLPTPHAAAAQLNENYKRLLDAGHYLSGMLEFQGVWYWGIDRLAHLEHDLLTAGYRRADESVGLLRRRRHKTAAIAANAASQVGEGQPAIDWFCSFRSPYAYVGAARTFELARRYPVRIRPRLILPMKMAGFPIPQRKSTYFRLDPAREALRHGVRFGNFCDPFGAGLERAMAALPIAETADRLEPYIMSVMTGIWADGIDTATDEGLRILVERAGLDWTEVAATLGDDGWRERADRNRQELAELGQYAAPTFRLGDWVTWGQDRIGMLEQRIRSMLP